MCWMPRARSVREGDRSHPSLRDAGHGFARGAGSKIFIASACFVRTSGARVGEICVPFPSSCAYVDLLLFITNLFVTPLVWHDGLSRPSHSLLEAVNRDRCCGMRIDRGYRCALLSPQHARRAALRATLSPGTSSAICHNPPPGTCFCGPICCIYICCRYNVTCNVYC